MIIAGLLPFAIVLIPIVWGLLRWRRARGGRFFGKPPRRMVERVPLSLVERVGARCRHSSPFWTSFSLLAFAAGKNFASCTTEGGDAGFASQKNAPLFRRL